MTAADLAALYPQSWIIGQPDGRFEPLPQFESGAVCAEIMLVRELVDDPIEDSGDVIDAVAWEAERPGIWWTITGALAYLGEWELRRAWWEERPARMVSTPAAFARDSASICILRWDADIDDVLGQVRGAVCDTPALAAKLRRTLFEQAAPRRRILEAAIRAFPITVAIPARSRTAA